MKKILYIIILCIPLTYCTSTKHLEKNASKNSLEQATDTTSTPDSETTYAKAEYIKGISQFVLKDYHKALNHLTKAYIILPNKSGVNFALADTYLHINDLVNAAYYGKQAVNLEPDNKWYRLKLAEIYQKSGDDISAIDQLKAVVQHSPRDVNTLIQIARLQTGQDQLQQAKETYNKVLGITGPDPSIYYEKFRLFQSLGQQDSMYVMLEKIHEQDPRNIGTISTLAGFYVKRHDIKKAKTLLQKSLDKMPDSPELMIMMSNLYFSESHLDSVRSLLSKPLGDPNYSPSRKMLIADYLVKRNLAMPAVKVHKMVFELLQRFLKTNPKYAPAHAVNANYYMSTGDTEKAREELTTASNLDPDDESIWMELLRLNFSTGKYKETIEKGIEANNHVPDNAFIKFAVGSSYSYLKNTEMAVKWLKEASKLPAKKEFKSIILGVLGDTYASQKNWASSDSAYNKALKANPNNDTVLNNFAYYLSVRDQRLEYAKDMADKALSIDPQNANYLDTMGWIFYKMKDYENAKKYLMQSISTGQPGAEVLEHMGDVYEKLGDHEEAQKWWEKALKKDPKRSYLQKKIK